MRDLNDYLPPMPPPQFARPAAVLMDALDTLSPPQRIDVPTWAERDRRLSSPSYTGKWRNDFAPYMTEPAAQMTSRRFGAVIFVGPARTAKTESLVLNTLGHRVCCNPRKMLIVCPTKDTAREFSIEKIDAFLRSTDEVRARQRTGRGADNTYDKLFAGNMRLRIGWPVIGQLSMFDIPDVLLTDYDRMVEDVDGEGTPFDLARKRNQEFGSLGKTAAEASPGRPVTDPDWKNSTPHEAPPTTGILALYNRGTRGRYYWNCPDCHEAFQPVFERLQWEDLGSAGASAKTVEMVCPHCGTCIPADRKGDLNRSGRWLHETDAGGLVPIGSTELRDTDIASFWCEGPVAAMQSWDQLVLRYLQAKEEFERTGDELALKTTVNVDQGRPFESAALNVGEGLSEDTLKALAKPYALDLAPAATRFITVQVDIQANRFVVHWDAWGEGLERWLIGRREITRPPSGAPDQVGERAIDPARYAEDWEVIWPLLETPVPVEASAYGLLPRALIMDMHGAPGVTANAYRFFRKVKAKQLVGRFYLSRGRGGWDVDRATYRAPEKVLGQVKHRVTDLRYIQLGTDTLKDEVTLALTRKTPGPGAYHLSDRLPDRVFAELAAEARSPSGWARRKHGLPNEALDLGVMGKGLAIVLKAEKIDWTSPPDWALPIKGNRYAVRIGSSDVPPPTQAAVITARPRQRQRKMRVN